MLNVGDEAFVFEDGEWRRVKIIDADWNEYRVLFIGTSNLAYFKKSEVVEDPFTGEKDEPNVN